MGPSICWRCGADLHSKKKVSTVPAISAVLETIGLGQPRGIRNNNPFNLVHSPSPWKGKITPSKDTRFEQFESMYFGVRAGLINIVNGYYKKGFRTLETIMHKYAPTSENKTENYIAYMTNRTGWPKDQIIMPTRNNLAKLGYWICMYENGKEALPENQMHEIIINEKII